MSNSAYCADNNVKLNNKLFNNVVDRINNVFPNNNIHSIVFDIIHKCWYVSHELHFLDNFYIDNICRNVKLNVNDINNLFGLNINNANCSYDEFIKHLENRIKTMINNTVQQINNHIDQVQNNNNMLKQIIIQELGDLYNSVKNITNNLFLLLENNLNANGLIAFNNHMYILILQNSINELDNIIQNNNDLRFRIIEYPQMVNQLETLYNELLNDNNIDDILHDGHDDGNGDDVHGNIIFDAKLLNNDIYDKSFDFVMNVINQINNSNNNSQITENLLTLTKRCGSFSSSSQLTIATLKDYNNSDDPNIITFNREFNYEDLHQQTNGIFTLNNNVPDKVTFTQVMTYFSNRVEIQLLQVIRNIIHDLKDNNYLSANDVQNIINQNIQQNIDIIKQVMNAALHFIQSDNQLNNDANINYHITDKIQSAINELRKFEKTALLDWQINVGLNDFPQNMGPNDLQMYMDKYVD